MTGVNIIGMPGGSITIVISFVYCHRTLEGLKDYLKDISTLDQLHLDLVLTDDVPLLVHIYQHCLRSLKGHQLGQGLRCLTLNTVKIIYIYYIIYIIFLFWTITRH